MPLTLAGVFPSQQTKLDMASNYHGKGGGGDYQS